MEYLHSISLSANKRTSQPSKKPPPLHKRHTKPCKFFQMSRCPYSAEVCNFAHVIVPEAREGPGAQLCRYYTAGKCTNDAQCRYRHSDEPAHRPAEIRPSYKPEALHVRIPDSQPTWHSGQPPLEKGYVDPSLYGPGVSPYYAQPPIHDWSYANGISVQSPVYLPLYANPPPHAPPHAVIPIGSKHDSRHDRNIASTGETPHKRAGSNPALSHRPREPTAGDRTPGAPYRTGGFDTHDHDDSQSTGSSSSLSSTSPRSALDQLIIATTEDPKYRELAHLHQSQVGIPDQSGMVHVPPGGMHVMAPPPMYGGVHPPRYVSVPLDQGQPRPQHAAFMYGMPAPVPPPYGVMPVKSAKDGASNPGSRAASRSSHRIKPSKYKTKPCRFWDADGTCPAGDECTFQHDEPHPPPVPPLPAVLFPAKYPSKPSQGQTETKSPSTVPPPPGIKRAASQDLSSGPVKDSSPVSWRVIGGGVRIGMHPSSRDSAATSNSSQFSDSLSVPDDSVCATSDSGNESEDSDFVVKESRAVGPQRPFVAMVPVDQQEDDDQRTLSRGGGGDAKQEEEREGGRERSGSRAAKDLTRARKRSSSIPPTPSSTQFKVGNLFSAESPGGL